MKYMNLIVKGYIFYQESINLNIFLFAIFRWIYYAQLEQSNTGQNHSINIFIKEWKPKNYPRRVCVKFKIH